MLIFDGSFLLHRIRFQSPSVDWKMYSFIFSRSILKTIKELGCKDVVVCWDLRGSKRRKSAYSWYKERAPIDESTVEGQQQQAVLKEYTNARKWLHTSLPQMGIKSIMIDGIEADDIAYWLVQNKSDSDLQNTLVTEDRDWIQSLRKSWTLYRPLSEQSYEFTQYVNDYSIPGVILPQDNFVLQKSILGDGSDNIPKCRGVGDSNIKSLSEKLLLKQPLDFKYKVSQNLYNFICSGQLSANLELIDFRCITRYERRRIAVAYEDSLKLVVTPDFMTWMELAEQINSTQMISFGSQYVDDWS